MSSRWGILGRARDYVTPILSKELLVSSRRRRTYLLRVFFLGCLAVYLGLLWAPLNAQAAQASFNASRMGELGRQVWADVLVFQVIAAELAAVILLAGTLSGELDNGTFAVLLSTPLTAGQIVLGKLLGGLSEIVLLLLLSLPGLAIARSLGGVPWVTVLAGLAQALLGALVFALLAMTLSARIRKAPYTMLLLGPVVVLLGLATAGNARLLLDPRSAWAQLIASLILGPALAAALAVLCRRQVVRMARRETQEPGPRPLAAPYAYIPGAGSSIRGIAWPEANPLVDPLLPGGEPVRQSPLVWRTMRKRMLRGKNDGPVMAAVVLFAMIYVYVWAASFGALGDGDFHAFVATALLLAGLAVTGVFAAATVAPDKESRLWPILLTTPLSDWEILFGKLEGVLRRSWPLGAVLAAHVLAFVLMGFIRPLGLLLVLLTATGSAGLLLGIGLAMSTLLSRTSYAVLATLALAVALWGALPGVLGMAHEAHLMGPEPCNAAIGANPFVQVRVVLRACAADGVTWANRDQASAAKPFDWPWDREGEPRSLAIILGVCVGNLLAASLLAWWAKSRFRVGVFGRER